MIFGNFTVAPVTVMCLVILLLFVIVFTFAYRIATRTHRMLERLAKNGQQITPELIDFIERSQVN